MAGVTFPKILALAAVGSTAIVGVLADAAAPGMVHDQDGHDGHDHDGHDHDHGAMEADLMAIGYKGYMGIDYVPMDGADAVAVDVGSAEVATAVECAMACEETPECSGASFYPDPEAYFGKDMKGCWLKTFTDTCGKPVDAVAEPLAVLLLKPAADCPVDAPMMAPMMAPVAMAPVADAPAAGPISADRDFTEDGSDAMSVRSAVAAVAVAGAMLVLA